MNQEHVDKGLRSFRKSMKGMTFKEKVKHFLYYYGKYTIIFAFLIFMFVDIVYQASRPKPEVLLSGTAVNVKVSEEAEKKLVEDAFAHMGGVEPGKQEVTLVPNAISNANLQLMPVLRTKMLAGDFDYMLLDQEALNVLVSVGAFADLERILSAEDMLKWGARFAYVEDKNDMRHPIAINIVGTPLAEQCVFESEYMYIAFPITEDQQDTVKPFFEYLSQELLRLED
ncbi:MAG: hypothetical protein E7462_02905 [Ruminococcaceae bacterium]|nr:hypothetical protein [Oscillospiraceae bacterium]